MIVIVRSTSSGLRQVALLALLLVLASSLLGCAGETGILVEVTSPDLAVPADVDTLRFQADGAAGVMASGVYPITSRWPHSLAIRPRAGDTSGGVTVRVVGLKGSVEVASTIVSAAFRQGEIVTVHAVLTLCPGADCVLDGGVHDLGADLGDDAGELLDGGFEDLGAEDLGTDELGVGDLGPSDLGRDLGPTDLGADLGVDDLGTDDLGVDDLGTDDLGVDDLGVSDLGTFSPLFGSLVISELATGSASGVDEFVELYNRTAVPLDIGAVAIEYASAAGTSYSNRAVVPAGTMLPAYSYFLVCSVGYIAPAGTDMGAAGVGTPDLQPSTWTSSMGLSATGGHVRLARGGEIIDLIGWRTAAFPEGTAVPGASTSGAWSYERKAYATSDITSMTTGADVSHGNGSDTNDNSADFISRPMRDPQNLASTPEVP